MKKDSLLNIIISKFNLDEKKATGFILSGNVLVNEIPVLKTGIKIDKEAKIRIKNKNKYVSRGAYKLLTAFENFSFSVLDKICIDIGSSTGGFTQVLLEKGAKQVYCVDCGSNLIDYLLRNNSKVIIFENTKIQDLKKIQINSQIDFAVMDVSFTSSVFIINYIQKEFNINEMVVLIKPQFEYEKLKQILSLSQNFNGIVKDDFDRKKILFHVEKEITQLGFNVINKIESSIKGTKGNIEYLFHIKNLE